MSKDCLWSPEDDQSILIEILSCNHQFFSELTLLLNIQGSKSVKNIYILVPKVYLLHLKVKHCQTVLTGKSIVWYCSGWSKLQ